METEIGDLGLRLLGASDSAVMILTCPDCATSYFVDDAKIPVGGRKVRCANCGARWMAEPTTADAAEGAAEPDAVEIVHTPPEETAAEAEAAHAGPTAAERRAAQRAEAEAAAGRRRRAMLGTLAIWGGLAAGLVALIAAAALLRTEVVRMWPRTAGVYAALGLPVNTIGLDIHDVKYVPTLQDGHASMAVSGVLRNVADHAVVAPPLRLRLLDAKGEPLATKIARPAEATIPHGESRHFTISILDWPPAARELEVGFALEGAKPAPSKHGVSPPPEAPHEAQAAEAHQAVQRQGEHG